MHMYMYTPGTVNIVNLTCTTSSICHASPVPWTPVNKTEIGRNDLNTATTLSYDIPTIIPDAAQRVLLYSSTHCGYSSERKHGDIKYYVVVDGIHYEQFLLMRSYDQVAINTNSDNMWFPMPPNRLIYIEVPVAFPNNCHTVVNVIGYQ